MDTAQTASFSPRLKQLYYRSWHRGCKETDILFGRFADTVLASLKEEEIAAYEALLEEADSDVWGWYTGQIPLPAEHNNAVWKQLRFVNEEAVKNL